jgi:hypothetical protein
MSSHLPPHLLESIDRGKCVLFIGSGVSATAGLPTAAMLTRLLAEASRYPATYAQDLLDVAEYYEAVHGRADLLATLKEHLRSPRPSRVHRQIAAMAPQFTSIVTTNYDSLLEEALDDLGQRYRRIADEADFGRSIGHEIALLKLHGDFSSRDIVLTRRDYQRHVAAASRSLMVCELKARLASGTVLFVGYSLRDYNFAALYSSVREVLGQFAPNNYAAVLESDPIDRRVWAKRGVDLLDIDASLLFDELQESFAPAERLRVFLSHSAKDIDSAIPIRTFLKQSGLDVFSAEDIRPGEDIRDIVRRQILRSNRFAVLVSRHFLASPWASYELQLAMALRPNRVVPVLLEDCELPIELRNIKHIDARHSSLNLTAAVLKDALEQKVDAIQQ